MITKYEYFKSTSEFVEASGLPIFWSIIIPGIPWGIIMVCCCMGNCMVNEGWVPMGNGMAPAMIGAAEYEGNADICRVVVTMKKRGGIQLNDHNCTTQTHILFKPIIALLNVQDCPGRISCPKLCRMDNPWE